MRQVVVRHWLRGAVAVIAGSITTVLLSYLGAVAFVIVRFGVPLGSSGRQPTAGEYLVLLSIATVASAIGGHICAGLARHNKRYARLVQAAVLGCGAVWGFTTEASRWPGWWAPALAIALAIGTWLGGATLTPKVRTGGKI